MGIIEEGVRRDEATPRQRWSHYFVLIYALVAFVIGWNLRDSTLNATVQYSNAEAGLRAFYPQNWLIDTEGDYVFRVRDMSQIGFKTTIQVDVEPVTLNTSARNLFDALILNRSQSLAGFSELAREPYVIGGETEATAVTYTFVSSEANPFLESLPVVVEGLDVLILEGGQAIIVTFLTDAVRYEAELPVFERFLNDLEF